MVKLAIVHFNPIELYPPVMNWLNYIAAQSHGELEVRVYTTHALNMTHAFEAPSGFIKIIRTGGIPQASSFRRYGTYVRFYAGTSLRLMAWKPDTVLYYETISSFPALLYKRVIRPRSRLFIHYHEYTPPEEYRGGMILNRWFHRLEQKTYSRTAWLSHTNEERLYNFEKDQPGISLPNKQVMPNYPPAAWTISLPKTRQNPLRIVYAGSLSLEAMYAREFAEWVLAQNGKVIWDIYAVNISGDTKEYLDGLNKDLVRFKGSCDYFELPALLSQYDVGVVLYKGIIPNHIIAVSNKVFEYLSRGLDVWYSREMTGTYAYDTSGVYPKVLAIDGKAMGNFNLDVALDRTGLRFQPCIYHCEAIFEPLFETIISG